MKKIKILLIIVFTTSATVIFMTWLAGYKIEKATNGLVYSDIEKIPHNKVGLLLGTSKYVRSGLRNAYYVYRINAAADLYKAGKINNIVVSGDNSIKEYNEPVTMKKDLIELGVPEDKIYLDYAGFRTFDSVIRANKIFGQEKFTIISQEFHNRRAIYIANNKNLEVVGYNAEDVNTKAGFRTMMREKFARVKVFLDLLTNKQPKFLGEKIEIK